MATLGDIGFDHDAIPGDRRVNVPTSPGRAGIRFFP
jgi:hypothetical protein